MTSPSACIWPEGGGGGGGVGTGSTGATDDEIYPVFSLHHCMEANYPSAMKNQRGASKIPLVGGILRSKAPSRGLWMPELVLYGIRELA